MYESAVQNLIDELGRLPGVGPKSAQRIAFYILDAEAEEMQKLTDAITRVKKTVSFCEICGNVSETKLCAICRDESRDVTALCVVEESKDVVAIERTRSFTGRYHVLGGSINPLAGIGPEQLRIRELVARLSDERINELILAMDPNLEGEATATYLSRLLVPIGIRVSRLASGLPVGGDLEYADEITLGRALEGRRVISEGNRALTDNSAQDFEAAIEKEAQQKLAEEVESKPRTRWSGSMFDDLGADSNAPENQQDTDQHKPPRGEQSDLNGPLLEAEVEEAGLEAQEEVTQDLPAEEAPAQPVPGELSPEERAERVAAAAFEAEEGLSAPETEEADTSGEAGQAQERREAYEQKLDELKKTPLRTVAPTIPPIPGKTYVNPWT
ncbi:recombination mediator RecR [Rothia endophytica]|uniref:Recombination protein RecR n=1 Tax=Rothia endophytica TaxID=1324766 RepID=A0ABP9BLV7_9MICC|nr:Recombination protein RecR [Mycobacteroides abscessus subsp. bolletii]